MKNILILSAFVFIFQINAQTYTFDFTTQKNDVATIKVDTKTIFTHELGYGYDLVPPPNEKSNAPWYFSISVPDGNYKVTVRIGSNKTAANTTIRAEDRRLYIDNCATSKREIVEKNFVVNKRNPQLDKTNKVRIKVREQGSLTWDDKLTLEINGSAPQIQSIHIEPANNIPTIFLCGNSTVVDQRQEPWASWGQMIPAYFNDKIAVANYAESGESAASFLGAGRLNKILAEMKIGDYVFIEFGHNDQKQNTAGSGAYFAYMTNLKIFVDEIQAKGGIPILVTPTQRRSFDIYGNLINTHGEYPDAMKFLAEKENVHLIDLSEMTKDFFEALGPEKSKLALVHYPANTFPNQDKPLQDNTHFNTYGANQVAKCVIEGIKLLDLELRDYIRSDFREFNPAQPDNFENYHWDLSPFYETEKPEGN